ncbi:MAG: presenilin family intramembrane aspartyl protease, partial [Candidatus Nanohaloarchaea archaeon]
LSMDFGDRSVLFMVGMFLSANLLGLAAGMRIQSSPVVQQASAAYQQPVSGVYFFLMIGLATVLLLGLYRYDAQFLVKAWFSAALLITGLVFFDAFLPLSFALAATAAVFLGRFAVEDMLARNALDTVPFAGAGALFGSLLGFKAALVLFGLLAVYDYVAVNRMGHMVTLAKKGAESGTFMGFRYPKENAGEEEREETPGEGEGVVAEVEGENVSVGVLGGGDVIMPMMFAVSLVPVFGVGAALGVIAGASAALYMFLGFIRSRETDRFYPAIPVVGSGSLLGLLAWLVVALV